MATFTHPNGDELAAQLRKAILTDLEKIENHHKARQVACGLQSDTAGVEHHRALVNSIRGCLVTAQAAVNRVILNG